MSMVDEARSLAFKGDWSRLLALLDLHPELVNVTSETKGYTPLHQAAWHGADLAVIGQLLRLGASRRARTFGKRQTAAEIAIEKHRDREDLAYVLGERRATIAQLMRKVIATNRDLFKAYDGNQVLADRLIACFGSDPCPASVEDLDRRLESAFLALTGTSWASEAEIPIATCENFDMRADGRFWASRFVPLIRKAAAEADEFVLETGWAVVSDLFDPAPKVWGLRGDLFLWLEMRQALCLVPIPEQSEAMRATIASAIHALIGHGLDGRADVFVRRYDRGGMSSGVVNGPFWVDKFTQLMEQRARWLASL
jgi:hypothetical protein